MSTSSDDWTLPERLVDEFKHELKLEHMRRMDQQGIEGSITDETMLNYETFCNTYDKMSREFKIKCPRAIFAFANNGLFQARIDDFTDVLQQYLYYFEDYNELCYCNGEFSEVIEFEALLNYIHQTHLEKYRVRTAMSKSEFKEWSEYVNDYIKFVLNPFNRTEILVTDVIESNILVKLRDMDSDAWLNPNTLKDFKKRFRDAVLTSQYSQSSNFLIKREFHALNVLDDDMQQPYSEEFVDRLFDYLAVKNNLDKHMEYRMDCRTFVNIRRMLFFSKSVATRQFLFELIDLKGDGFIDVDEVRHFYNGLQNLHNEFDMNGESPFAHFDEFYISWFDQISPVDDCLDKKLSFEDFKNHRFGDEALLMLINYKALVNFDRRFELPDSALDADTLDLDNTLEEDENDGIKDSDLDYLLGPSKILRDKTNSGEDNNASEMRILALERSPKAGKII